MDSNAIPAYALFRGNHLFAELYGIRFEYLDSVEFLTQVLSESIPFGNATVRGIISEKFDPCGVSVVALLSESHASFHTYPEHGCLFLDVFTCGDCQPQAICDAIVDRLSPERTSVSEIVRGWSDESSGINTTGAVKSLIKSSSNYSVHAQTRP